MVARIVLFLTGLALASLAPAWAHAQAFTFVVSGETFTYTDAQRSFSGRLLVPAGSGPFPAIVFNHGQGGTPYTYPNLTVMRDWGAVVIAPNLTHIAGGETAPATTGMTTENVARGIACADALATLNYVDISRLAVFGHSKGAYASIGLVSALGTRVRVAGISAGGVVPDSVGTAQAAPTYTEASGVVAPFILFHGNIDPAVPPAYSADFQSRLDSASVPVSRIVYDVSALPPSTQHNLHQDPTINADLLQRLHDWYAQWGLFGADDGLFADGFDGPP
jgi:dienelactone hydrolase